MNHKVWHYRLSNYGCGALAAVGALLLRGLGVSAYSAGYAHGLKGMPELTVLSVVVAFVVIDGLYYLQHRLEHRVGWLWAIHSVHHQSEICDMSVSLRISFFASLAIGLFHLPLALLGVNPQTYLAAYLLHVAIVVTFHSRTPAWLDRAGRVFNSPYLHRLHHASNEALRDTNFAGVLVVWDRLFGTFRGDHSEALVFGVDGQPTPLSPIAANVKPLRALFRARSSRIA
jgi:sterol desaturase/sphingolipid hydroxylase (fatty acid hydroxylase superfamily)